MSEATVSALLADGPLRTMGVMRIKNEERWIRASLESQLPICDKVLVLDDHSTDDTRDIVRSFGRRVVLLESPFEGVSEGRDKRHLLQHVLRVNPEWVLWIDGDEVLTSDAAEIALRELTTEATHYWLRMLYFWDNVHTIRTDGVYGTIGRPSLFRVMGQDATKLHIPIGSGAADLHNNGNCPVGLTGDCYRSSIRIKHYGYLDRKERQRKYEFYNKVDPNNESEDCYRHIIEIPGVWHAPGPTVLEHWSEQ